MAPALAIIAAVGAIVGGIASSIAQSNALRREARQRILEGEQELLASQRQFRQELGQDVVAAGGSGLLGASFSAVFESQAVLDAEFLSQLKQRTDFDVKSLRSQAKSALLIGILSAGQKGAQGIASARQGAAERRAARDRQARISGLNAAQQAPGTSGNIFSKTTGSPSPSLFRSGGSATFF